MSWLFSRVLVEEYLGENFSDGEPSAPLNGNPIQQAYCAPDKMTVFSRLSRFGMTYKPLTDIPGEELSMSSVVDFHVRTFQQQEKAQELTDSVQECGEKWRASFTKYDHNSSLWRTHQCSLLGDLEPFSETWPQWGLMRDGECWEQRMLEQTIRGTESGLSEKLPTPQASDHITKKTSTSWKAKGGVNFSLANPEIQAKWPTPRSCSAMAATITPESAWNEKRNPNLETIVGRRTWGTPKAQDSRHALKDRGKGNLGEQVSGLHNGGKLNPLWTEWLMGWWIGWTDLKPLEMDKSHCALPKHGDS